MRVAIAGGGLGGLSAALFLLRAGVRDVRVFEQQADAGRDRRRHPDRARTRVRLLQRLGLGDGADGGRGAVRGGVGVPALAGRARALLPDVRRGGRGALRRAVPGDPPRGPAATCWPRRVPDGRRRARAAASRASTATASSLRGRLGPSASTSLIGADGIHSVVRAAIARPGLAGVHGARGLPRAGAGRGGAGVRAPAGLLDLARPAPALRPLPGLRRATQVNLVTANPAGDWREESWTADGHASRTSSPSSPAGTSRCCS